METIGANIFVETVYPGVNVGCIVTDVGAVCIDTPMLSGEAQRWWAQIRSRGAEQVRFVVYTSGQSERTLGTQYLIFDEKSQDEQSPRVEQALPARQVVSAQRGLFARLASRASVARAVSGRKGAVVAHNLAWDQVKEQTADAFKQSLIDTLGDRDPDMANLQVVLPQITFDQQIRLYAGDLMITLLGVARGTSWVWLAEQQVLFTGDTVVVGSHPPLCAMDFHGWLAALQRLCKDPCFQDARIVPGRGPLSDVSVTEPLIEYLGFAMKQTKRVLRAGHPKADLNEVAEELLPRYPVPDGQRERVQRQIKLALDGLYDELKAADAAVD